MSRWYTRLSRVGCMVATVATLFVRPSAAAAQTGELAVGVAPLGAFSVDGKTMYKLGGTIQAGVFGVVAPRVRLGAELTGISFYRPQAYPAPCPPGPICITQIWVDRFSSIAGLAATGQLDLDRKGRVFVTAGVSGNELFLLTPQFHPGISAGAGVTFPFTGTHLAVLKAEWTELSGDTEGFSRFVPISFGVRF